MWISGTLLQVCNSHALRWGSFFHFKNRLYNTLHLICAEGVSTESCQEIAGVLLVPMSVYLAVTSLCQQVTSIYAFKEEHRRSRNLLPA